MSPVISNLSVRCKDQCPSSKLFESTILQPILQSILRFAIYIHHQHPTTGGGDVPRDCVRAQTTAMCKRSVIGRYQPRPEPCPISILSTAPQTELGSIQPGDVLERIAPRPNQRIPYETTGRVAPPPPVSVDPFEGTWEVLLVGQDEKPFLDRHDVWGWVPNSIVVDVRPEDNLCQLEDFGR